MGKSGCGQRPRSSGFSIRVQSLSRVALLPGTRGLPGLTLLPSSLLVSYLPPLHKLLSLPGPFVALSSFKRISFVCMGVLPAYISVHMPDARSLVRTSGPLELESQTVVSSCMGAEN